MISLNTNINANSLSSAPPLTSTTQITNVASKIDLAIPTSQGADIFTAPMIPGYGKGSVIYIAADFDEPLEFGN